MSYQQDKFKEIADVIREKTGTADAIKPSDFASKVNDVYEAGKKAEYDAFWDAYQQNGNRTDNRYFCSYYNFTEETFKPKYPIMLSSYTFDSCTLNISLIEKGIELLAPAFTSSSMGYCFRSSRFTEIPTVDGSKGNSLVYGFANCPNLRKINKIISVEKVVYTGAFNNCPSLEEIEFEGVIGNNIDFGTSPLKAKSIISIIEHLSDTATDTGQTLTLKQSAVDAMEFPCVSEQSGSTYTSFDDEDDPTSLVKSKPNWTISLR